MTERIPTHTRGTPPNRLRGVPGCAIEAGGWVAGFAPRSSRYCSRAAVLSVGEAAQLVRIVLIAPHRPAFAWILRRSIFLHGSCESARFEE